MDGPFYFLMSQSSIKKKGDAYGVSLSSISMISPMAPS